MSSSVFGTLAAAAGPLVMIVGLYIWDKHWTRGSAFALNLFKCCLASIGFLLASYAARPGRSFPRDIFTAEAIGFLFLSSTLGILIGDWAWLEAQQKIGTLRVVLVDTTKPFLAALLGWIILKEQLRWEAFAGMALTVGGVLVVTLESNVTSDETVLSLQNREHTEGIIVSNESNSITSIEGQETIIEEGDTEAGIKALDDVSFGEAQVPATTSNATVRYGYFMATLNVGLDTYGSLLTKDYGVGMNSWEISLLRFGFAGAVMLLVSIIMHTKDHLIITETPKVIDSSHWYLMPHLSRRTWGFVIAGVALVTFLAPALSNYSLFQIPLALAITLGSIGPLYALPLDLIIKGKRPTVRSIVGSVLAVAGIIILAVRGT